MQDRKEYILNKAFEVFMAKGYDSASMTVLQQELKMSRGAMYRYYDSKDDLFRAVIDHYFFGLIDRFSVKTDENISLAERIELHCHNLQKICAYFDKIDSIEVMFLNYTALIIQAAKRYSGFLERLKIYKEKELLAWQHALENSINSGELRKDTDVKIMAQVFSKAFDMNEADRFSLSFTGAAELTRKMMHYMYSLIKV